MITLLPNASPQDLSLARDIIAMVTDPAAAKARMNELETMAEHAGTQVENATQLQKEVDAKIAANDAAAKDLSERTAAFAEYSANRGDQLTRMSDALSARQKALDSREADSIASITSREAAVQAREDSVKTRETAVAALEARNNAVKADLDRRMEIIKSAGS